MNLTKPKIISFLDKATLFCIYATAYFLPISQAIIESLSILAIVCFLIKKFLEQSDIQDNKLNLPILIYGVVCILSIFLSTNMAASLRTFYDKILQNIAFFIVVADTLNTKNRIRNVLYVFFVSATLLGIDGVYQHFTRKEFIRHRPYYDLPRIHATFPTPNAFGCYLYSMMALVLAYLFGNIRHKFFKLFLIGLFILLSFCLFFTVSRGAWFAFVVIIFFMSIWLRPIGLFFMVFVFIIVATKDFYGPFLKERLNHFFAFLDNSSSDRKIIWHAAWNMFMSRPWIGLGVGTFMLNFSKFASQGYPHGVPYAHNCYLQIATETGIVGLVAFLSILGIFFYNGIKFLNTKEKAFNWFVVLGALAAILGYCVQMGVDTIFFALDLGLLFWFILGIGQAAQKNL